MVKYSSNPTPRNVRESNGVKYWETYNDANYNNRHVKAEGVEFFAFPFSPFMDCVGNRRSVTVGGVWRDNKGHDEFCSVQAGNVQPSGSVTSTGWYKFSTPDEAFIFAARQVKLEPEAAAEIGKLVKAEDWKTIAVFTTHSLYGEAARLELEYNFGPLTELQEEVLAGLRTREYFGIADSVEHCWRLNRMAYVDDRTPIPGLRRKFDQANKVREVAA